MWLLSKISLSPVSVYVCECCSNVSTMSTSPNEWIQRRLSPTGKSKRGLRWADVPSLRKDSNNKSLLFMRKQDRHSDASTALETLSSASGDERKRAARKIVEDHLKRFHALADSQKSLYHPTCNNRRPLPPPHMRTQSILDEDLISRSSSSTAASRPIDVDSVQEYVPSPNDITLSSPERLKQQRQKLLSLQPASTDETGPVDVDTGELLETKDYLDPDASDTPYDYVLDEREFTRGIVGYIEGFEPPRIYECSTFNNWNLAVPESVKENQCRSSKSEGTGTTKQESRAYQTSCDRNRHLYQVDDDGTFAI